MEIVNNLASGSKSRYKKTYQDFQKWIKLKGETTITEDILLTYFSEIGEKNKPTTLWAYHSMLKATLKSKNIGYQPVKPKMFTLEEVAKFINEAKDEYWLDVKQFHLVKPLHEYLATIRFIPLRMYVNGTPERYTVRSVKSVPSPINTISASADHVCNLNCGQVECASEAHVNDVFHAFSIFKSSEYTVEDVTPALFTSKPTCRWIVAYKHNSEPINYDNSDEKFEDITRSTPNNVKAIESFVRMNSVQSFAAYVVIYGVNCRCQKRNWMQ
ncbi:hypothetical protein Bhyg_01950 [Pseudolycoriella hygida]|uniref:Uncharacterized protein n=1 Tax=Pseudolycoriella hygida TaxID=35572 RepID=A0A9Q0NAD3_9DIPT|nr:hypothetical protein Bhyg_01950 [Pseudolycoriella hygida]